MSDANRVSVIYVAESTYGQTPVDSPNWNTARFTSETFGAETQTAESEEVRADRMTSDLIKTGLNPAGTLGIELSDGTYDDFLEAVLGGQWASDVLKVGASDYSFTFQKEFQDITGDRYLALPGMRVGQMSLAAEFGSRITGEIQFAGSDASINATSLVGVGAVADPTTSPVFDASSNISDVKIDGVAGGECIQTLNLTMNANLRPKGCLGRVAPADQVKGGMSISGDMTLYLEDLDLEKKKLENTSISLEFTLSRGGTGYTFLLPNIKIGGSTPGSSGRNQDVFLEASFTALYDETEGSSITITRI